jgi:hypothetical protein
MVAVAAVAVGLVLIREFEDGIPPKYVLRRIPARITQLRPGMSRAQTQRILGLKESWMWGGSSASLIRMEGTPNVIHETYGMRPRRIVGTKSLFESSVNIQLHYHMSRPFPERSAAYDYVQQVLADESVQLVSASFVVDGQTVARMPGPR